ncbi:putative disease resistance protein At4g27220 [Primulina tabacum]|uniref:putative disease resistance protein At4g27220 n=1 Tax=Primulina tabacum TaxID=48773 RepID=UPI003F591EA1
MVGGKACVGEEVSITEPVVARPESVGRLPNWPELAQTREEAWILFSEEAGISANDCTNLYAIAKDIANECKGLPVALASVARALKQKSHPTWENALVQLRNSTPTNILGVLNDVYRPLELSYLALEGNDAKDLFLLCSLFREDSSICIENLVRYGIGLETSSKE